MNRAARVFSGLLVTAVSLLPCACQLHASGEQQAARELSRAQQEGTASEVQHAVLDPHRSVLDLAANGLKVSWRQELRQTAGEKDLTHLYLFDNLLVAQTLEADLLLLDATSGTWQIPISFRRPLPEAPTMGDGTMYVRSRRSRVGIDIKTGEVKMELPPRLAASCPSLYYEGDLIIGTGTGRIYRLDLETDIISWFLDADGPVFEQPVIAEGRIYAAGYGGSAKAIEAGSGKDLWSWKPKLPAKINTGLTYWRDRLYVADNLGFLYCLEPDLGVDLWRYPIGGMIHTRPVQLEDKLLVFTYSNEMSCLGAAAKPEVLWTHPDAVRLVAKGKKWIYLLTRDHSLCAVDPKDGKEQWRVRLAPDCKVTSDPNRPRFFLWTSSGSIAAIRELD